MNAEFNGPTIKRVVNVNKMKFHSSLPQNVEAFSGRTDSDLHRFQSSKDVDYVKTLCSRRPEQASNFMRQMSELELEDNYSNQKTNPIFQNDYENEQNLSAKPVEATVVKAKKTPLELMFERLETTEENSGKNTTRITVKYENKNQDREKNAIIYDGNYERIFPDVEAKAEELSLDQDALSFFAPKKHSQSRISTKDRNKNLSIQETIQENKIPVNQDEIYDKVDYEETAENDEDKLSLSNFDSVSLSSYKIQERKNSEISAKVKWLISNFFIIW